MITEEKQETVQVASLEESLIMSVVMYFNIFNHPLTETEIFDNSRLPITAKPTLQRILKEMTDKGWLYCFDGYFTVQNKPELVVRRKAGNKRALKYLKRAQMVSRYISYFPFVRGVMISGSLSKNYMEEGSDVDYFIVTEAGRLWLCRSILALQRKLLIKPLRKYFCINYFVTTSTLAIPDKNIFTATEIMYVYPTYGQAVYERLIFENKWAKDFYPNKQTHGGGVYNAKHQWSIKAIAEFLMGGVIGDKLDGLIFRWMLKRWKKRYKDEFDETEYDVNIRTKKNVSKQHEKGYQFVILKKLEEQRKAFESDKKIRFNHG